MESGGDRRGVVLVLGDAVDYTGNLDTDRSTGDWAASNTWLGSTQVPITDFGSTSGMIYRTSSATNGLYLVTQAATTANGYKAQTWTAVVCGWYDKVRVSNTHFSCRSDPGDPAPEFNSNNWAWAVSNHTTLGTTRLFWEGNGSNVNRWAKFTLPSSADGDVWVVVFTREDRGSSVVRVRAWGSRNGAAPVPLAYHSSGDAGMSNGSDTVDGETSWWVDGPRASGGSTIHLMLCSALAGGANGGNMFSALYSGETGLQGGGTYDADTSAAFWKATIQGLLDGDY